MLDDHHTGGLDPLGEVLGAERCSVEIPGEDRQERQDHEGNRDGRWRLVRSATVVAVIGGAAVVVAMRVVADCEGVCAVIVFIGTDGPHTGADEHTIGVS